MLLSSDCDGFLFVFCLESVTIKVSNSVAMTIVSFSALSKLSRSLLSPPSCDFITNAFVSDLGRY